MCVSNESHKKRENVQREMFTFRKEHSLFFLCGECRISEMKRSVIELYVTHKSGESELNAASAK